MILCERLNDGLACAASKFRATREKWAEERAAALGEGRQQQREKAMAAHVPQMQRTLSMERRLCEQESRARAALAAWKQQAIASHTDLLLSTLCLADTAGAVATGVGGGSFGGGGGGSSSSSGASRSRDGDDCAAGVGGALARALQQHGRTTLRPPSSSSSSVSTGQQPLSLSTRPSTSSVSSAEAAMAMLNEALATRAGDYHDTNTTTNTSTFSVEEEDINGGGDGASFLSSPGELGSGSRGAMAGRLLELSRVLDRQGDSSGGDGGTTQAARHFAHRGKALADLI